MNHSTSYGRIIVHKEFTGWWNSRKILNKMNNSKETPLDVKTADRLQNEMRKTFMVGMRNHTKESIEILELKFLVRG